MSGGRSARSRGGRVPRGRGRGRGRIRPPRSGRGRERGSFRPSRSLTPRQSKDYDDERYYSEKYEHRRRDSHERHMHRSRSRTYSRSRSRSHSHSRSRSSSRSRSRRYYHNYHSRSRSRSFSPPRHHHHHHHGKSRSRSRSYSPRSPTESSTNLSRKFSNQDKGDFEILRKSTSQNRPEVYPESEELRNLSRETSPEIIRKPFQDKNNHEIFRKIEINKKRSIEIRPPSICTERFSAEKTQLPDEETEKIDLSLEKKIKKEIPVRDLPIYSDDESKDSDSAEGSISQKKFQKEERFTFEADLNKDIRSQLLERAMIEKRKLGLENPGTAEKSSALEALQCYSPETHSPSPFSEHGYEDSRTCYEQLSKRNISNLKGTNKHPLKSILKSGKQEIFLSSPVNKPKEESEQLPTIPGLGFSSIEDEEKFLYGDDDDENNNNSNNKKDSPFIEDVIPGLTKLNSKMDISLQSTSKPDIKLNIKRSNWSDDDDNNTENDFSSKMQQAKRHRILTPSPDRGLQYTSEVKEKTAIEKYNSSDTIELKIPEKHWKKSEKIASQSIRQSPLTRKINEKRSDLEFNELKHEEKLFMHKRKEILEERYSKHQNPPDKASEHNYEKEREKYVSYASKSNFSHKWEDSIKKEYKTENQMEFPYSSRSPAEFSHFSKSPSEISHISKSSAEFIQIPKSKTELPNYKNRKWESFENSPDRDNWNYYERQRDKSNFPPEERVRGKNWNETIRYKSHSRSPVERPEWDKYKEYVHSPQKTYERSPSIPCHNRSPRKSYYDRSPYNSPAKWSPRREMSPKEDLDNWEKCQRDRYRWHSPRNSPRHSPIHSPNFSKENDEQCINWERDRYEKSYSTSDSYNTQLPNYLTASQSSNANIDNMVGSSSYTLNEQSYYSNPNVSISNTSVPNYPTPTFPPPTFPSSFPPQFNMYNPSNYQQAVQYVNQFPSNISVPCTTTTTTTLSHSNLKIIPLENETRKASFVTISDEENKHKIESSANLSSCSAEQLLSKKAENKKHLILLQKEIGKLQKMQGEMMRKKQKEKDGHKDALIVENTKLQDEVNKQIKEVKTALYEINKALAALVKSKIDPEEPQEPSESNISGDEFMEETTFKFKYFDPGNHWCKQCNEVNSSILKLFEHLHSSKHKQKMDPCDRPWLPNTKKQSDKISSDQAIAAPLKGVQFLMPVEGFYCSLCKEIMGDATCAEDHLKSTSHNRNYTKYTLLNPFYERRWNLDKTAGIARAEKEEKKRLLFEKEEKKRQQLEIEAKMKRKKEAERRQKEIESAKERAKEHAVECATERAKELKKFTTDNSFSPAKATTSVKSEDKGKSKGIKLTLLSDKGKLNKQKKDLKTIHTKETKPVPVIFIGKAPNFRSALVNKQDVSGFGKFNWKKKDEKDENEKSNEKNENSEKCEVIEKIEKDNSVKKDSKLKKKEKEKNNNEVKIIVQQNSFPLRKIKNQTQPLVVYGPEPMPESYEQKPVLIECDKSDDEGILPSAMDIAQAFAGKFEEKQTVTTELKESIINVSNNDKNIENPVNKEILYVEKEKFPISQEKEISSSENDDQNYISVTDEMEIFQESSETKKNKTENQIVKQIIQHTTREEIKIPIEQTETLKEIEDNQLFNNNFETEATVFKHDEQKMKQDTTDKSDNGSTIEQSLIEFKAAISALEKEQKENNKIDEFDNFKDNSKLDCNEIIDVVEQKQDECNANEFINNPFEKSITDSIEAKTIVNLSHCSESKIITNDDKLSNYEMHDIEIKDNSNNNSDVMNVEIIANQSNNEDSFNTSISEFTKNKECQEERLDSCEESTLTNKYLDQEISKHEITIEQDHNTTQISQSIAQEQEFTQEISLKEVSNDDKISFENEISESIIIDLPFKPNTSNITSTKNTDSDLIETSKITNITLTKSLTESVSLDHNNYPVNDNSESVHSVFTESIQTIKNTNSLNVENKKIEKETTIIAENKKKINDISNDDMKNINVDTNFKLAEYQSNIINAQTEISSTDLQTEAMEIDEIKEETCYVTEGITLSLKDKSEKDDNLISDLGSDASSQSSEKIDHFQNHSKNKISMNTEISQSKDIYYEDLSIQALETEETEPLQGLIDHTNKNEKEKLIEISNTVELNEKNTETLNNELNNQTPLSKESTSEINIELLDSDKKIDDSNRKDDHLQN